jgi:thiol:disulfide interchange protein DsbC
MLRAKLALALGIAASGPSIALAAANGGSPPVAAEAAQKLHQSFANLKFQDFAPSPIRGPIYQANAGGRILYYAPDSGHLLFAAVYDKDGVNLTALAESEVARRHLSAIDPAKALVIGPAGAPTVVEFTDPQCPYCRALEKFWATKAAEGKPVRRLVYFVSSIHPQAAALAEHILCSPDKSAAFHATYAGTLPATLAHCPFGHDKVANDGALVTKIGVAGTPTLVIDGKLVSGFQQGEIEAWIDQARSSSTSKPATRADHGSG